ncbi:MAG: Na+/H+ antiporter [Actinomycetota bacterium]
MNPALGIVALVVTVAVVAGAARRFGWSPPLLLIGAGVIASYTPGVPEVRIDPQLILIGLLPPLLYAAAIRTSLVDVRANRQAILLLSVGLVAFTTLVVGLVTWLVVPAATLAAGFALGAVVAPPDAVAATTIARRAAMPRRLVTILEGESLLNDATALVALNTAIAAITSVVTVQQVAGDFLLAAAGGLLTGLLAAFLLAKIRKRLTDPVLDTTLSFVAPYVAFLPAQAIHASGVLAVVVTGLVLGHKAHRLQTAASRLAENTNWSTVQFLLENVVFILIGLQLRSMLDGVREAGTSSRLAALSCAAVLVAVIGVRVLWMAGVHLVFLLGTRKMREKAWSWHISAVVSWAGMRGVVTLAAALLLPEQTPGKPLLQLIAFTVVAGTLLIHGLTLPRLVRTLDLRGPDAAEDALQAASLLHNASLAGLARLDEVRTSEDPEPVIDQLRDRAGRRSNIAWERLGRSQRELEPPSAVYRRLRIEMLDAEREEILRARDAGTVDDEVLRGALAAVDLEESMLDRIEDAEPRPGDELTTPEGLAEDCDHLDKAPRVIAPQTPGQCQECLREGTSWVHLRLCLTCGQVGCCDSSERKHATAHFHDTDHPVMRSVEPGEAWRWCYVDELLG